MTDIFPVTTTDWKVRWETDNNGQVNPSRVRVWALCAPDTIAD